jgi:hypothetical protein
LQREDINLCVLLALASMIEECPAAQALVFSRHRGFFLGFGRDPNKASSNSTSSFEPT